MLPLFDGSCIEPMPKSLRNVGSKIQPYWEGSKREVR
jgi:hypothetical protein